MEDDPAFAAAAAAFGFVGAAFGVYFGWYHAGIGGVIAGALLGFMIGSGSTPVLLPFAGFCIGLGLIAIILFSIWHFWGVGKPPEVMTKQSALKVSLPSDIMQGWIT